MILALLVAVIVCGMPLQAKKKPSANAPADTGPKRVAFDISKIVWPSPPAIARVRFQAILTGQRIDWAGLTSTQKPKQSWMDRLAGEQPDRQVKDVQKKVGFQLMRVYRRGRGFERKYLCRRSGSGRHFHFPEIRQGARCN